MIRFFFAAALIAASVHAEAAGVSALCAKAAPDLIYASCRNPSSRAGLILLPEDQGATPADALDLTAAYTATDKREGGAPKPVGLFVRAGDVVSREYVRFDGVLTILQGQPKLHYRRQIRFGGDRFDLEKPEDRQRFLKDAATGGADVLQSHLLIIEGAVDTAPVAGAPRFRRRILFETFAGEIGIFDSSPRPLTLHEAAEEVALRFAPRMALNLDMGSYDFCRRGETLCGALAPDETSKLSNLIRLW